MQSKKGPPVVSFRDWFTTIRSSSAKPGRVSAAQPSSARPPLPLPAHEPCLQLHSSLPVVSYHGDDECHNFAAFTDNTMQCQRQYVGGCLPCRSSPFALALLCHCAAGCSHRKLNVHMCMFAFFEKKTKQSKT